MPSRDSWGSDRLTYQVTRGSTTTKVVDLNYLVVDEVLPEGQLFLFGEMRLCNEVGCAPPHDIFVNVPYRPNKPTVELLGVSSRFFNVFVTS